MKYTVETEINLPIARVVELFDDPENLKHWQPGLLSFEPISGTPGQPGAKSKLKYKMGKRDIEMIETITVRNLPDEFSGTYEAKGVFNIVKNYFRPVSENKTKYINESEFQFNGFMKLIGFLMPGAFRKESEKYLLQFKEFAEKQGT
ncbi:MAG: SRPBCC family protein [Ignavibacteria bacterium]|nr:SRPBCC family protein [Ignavibacteria bacterium]MBK9225573.1 SRPBCC family protein [Ignavibacteria bacterium]